MYKFEGDNLKSPNALCIGVTVTKRQFPKDRRKMKTARENAPRVTGLKSVLVRGRDIAVRKGKKSHWTCAFSAKNEVAKHGEMFSSLAGNNTNTLARCTHGTMKTQRRFSELELQ